MNSGDLISESVSLEGPDAPNLEDRLFAEYIKKCYDMWYEGTSEDYSGPEMEMREAYCELSNLGKGGEADEVIVTMAQDVYKDNEKLDAERQQLVAQEVDHACSLY
jgi:uncharacterized Zn finger protein